MKRIISTEKAPAAIGPYSQATIVNGLLFTSGQIALNPVSGELVMDTIEAETHQVLQNLGALLEAAGASYRDVIKCSVFVKDMHQYARINAVYATYFEEGSAPARELVEVANLPRFVNIEISLIAEMPQ
jgi:2-iminobutanoate/2-iminopropanoate deaminase